MADKTIARPFRLEREGILRFSVPTFKHRISAVLRAQDWASANPGKLWRVVERLNKSGSKRRIVASSRPEEVQTDA